MTTEAFDQLIADLRDGKLGDEIPPHGTLTRRRQKVHANEVGAVPLDAEHEAPVWITKHAEPAEAGS